MTNKCKIEKDELKYLRKLIDNDLGNAEDNLNRAKISFRGQNLNEKYGQSYETKREIIDGYKAWYDKASKVKKIFENMK